MLSSNLEITLRNAYQLASEHKHEFVTLEHLLKSLTDDKDAISVLKACGVEIEELKNNNKCFKIENMFNKLIGYVVIKFTNIEIDKETFQIAEIADLFINSDINFNYNNRGLCESSLVFVMVVFLSMIG